jgi:hypothetical protein
MVGVVALMLAAERGVLNAPTEVAVVLEERDWRNPESRGASEEAG